MSLATALHRIQPPLAWLSTLALGLAACALLGLVLVQGWQVLSRYGFNASPSWTEPVTVVLLGTAMSLGAAAAVHHQRHFGFFLLHARANTWMRRCLEGISALVMTGIGSTMAGWAAVLFLDGWQIKAAGAAMPQSLHYLPLSIGGILMVLFALNRLAQALIPLPPQPQAETC